MKPRQSARTAEKIARYVCSAKSRDPGKTVTELAKEHLLDGFAAMMSGATQEPSLRIDTYLREQCPGAAQATVIGSGLKLAAPHAALANAVRGHVMDYDDVQLSTLRSRPYGQLTHPTTPVLAAALALAEKITAGGRELLTAYIVGVEVACRIADAIDPRHYLNGFHPTGTIGAFGAGAACAHLLRLDRKQTGWTLGIIGSLASGLRAHRGTMAKSLSAGRAAENGVLAATLAQGGFTASSDVFDAPMGFFSAACYGAVDTELIRFGQPHFLIDPGIAVKMYPCAAVLHPLLDAIIELAAAHDLKPADVERIRIWLGPDAALPLVYERPQSALEAKFSLNFSAAVALARRRAGLGEYSDGMVRDPQILSLMKRVDLLRKPRLRSSGNLGSPAEVRIELRSGRLYRRRAIMAKGHPKKPASRAEIEDKFRQCAEPRVSPAAIGKFIDGLWSIEKVASLEPWLKLLRPRRRR